MSAKKQKSNSEYNKLRLEYLKNNPYCKAKLHGCSYSNNLTIHHMKGRIGDNMLDISTWVTLCMRCHMQVELNPRIAKLLGFSQSRLNK